jgi:hypothetical protein
MVADLTMQAAGVGGIDPGANFLEGDLAVAFLFFYVQNRLTDHRKGIARQGSTPAEPDLMRTGLIGEQAFYDQ